MLQSHRRQHLFVFGTLAILGPVLLVSALISRRPIAINDSLPSVFTEIPDVELREIGRQRVQLDSIDFSVHYLISADTGLFVAIQPISGISDSQPLLYWHEGRPGTLLPADAYLLGEIEGVLPQRFSLPSDALAGSLWLYSLAHQHLLVSAPINPAD
jgi:hypothetical protein